MTVCRCQDDSTAPEQAQPAVLAAILGFPATWVIGVAAFLSGGNYLYAHFGLLRVAEAVAWAASAKRAA